VVSNGTGAAAPRRPPPPPPGGVESTYAWLRLAASVCLGTIGGVGMWSVVVALPAVQAEFGVARGGAALPYALVTLGFGAGGVLMGRLADRFGVFVPVVVGAFSLGLGYVAVSQAGSLWLFSVLYGLLIGLFGTSTVFGPLIADASHWFDRRRGVAVALVACGNYFAGAVWPPVLQRFIETAGWRQAHLGVGVFCLATMLPLAFALRRPMPSASSGPAALAAAAAASAPRLAALGLSPNGFQALLMLAGVGCCVAMSMPQVHIVAYCVDLGYGAARGAEMLSLMLACGVASRLFFGAVMDRIGGLSTLLLGSALQSAALALFLPFDGLVSLYVISAVFGLFQGGIVPSYAMAVREFFPAREAGTRVGLALGSTLAGMALGGWMSGAIFDATGSYQAAVVNGLLWNGMNMAVAAWLLFRSRRRVALA
jgi:MFS family permease